MTRRLQHVTVKQSFDTVVSDHGPTVLRMCRAVLGPVDADDAWSETFLSALKAYPDLPVEAYGEVLFPLQVVINLNDPGVDHTGGEFLLYEPGSPWAWSSTTPPDELPRALHAGHPNRGRSCARTQAAMAITRSMSNRDTSRRPPSSQGRPRRLACDRPARVSLWVEGDPLERSGRDGAAHCAASPSRSQDSLSPPPQQVSR